MSVLTVPGDLFQSSANVAERRTQMREELLPPAAWRALPATPALKRSLIFNDLAGRPATPASLDNADVGTNPSTAE